ncbi:MAG: hypothetical protein AB7S38_40170 [Vulcanimicrobiota bacterium]
MGLDGLSLLLHLEAEFDLAIADDDAMRLCTVGRLYSYLLRSHGLCHPWPCPTVAVHRRLLDWLDSGQKMLQPRQDWWKLAAATGWPLPPLERGLPYSCRTTAQLARAITLLQEADPSAKCPVSRTRSMRLIHGVKKDGPTRFSGLGGNGTRDTSHHKLFTAM